MRELGRREEKRRGREGRGGEGRGGEGLTRWSSLSVLSWPLMAFACTASFSRTRSMRAICLVASEIAERGGSVDWTPVVEPTEGTARAVGEGRGDCVCTRAIASSSERMSSATFARFSFSHSLNYSHRKHTRSHQQLLMKATYG